MTSRSCNSLFKDKWLRKTNSGWELICLKALNCFKYNTIHVWKYSIVKRIVRYMKLHTLDSEIQQYISSEVSHKQRLLQLMYTHFSKLLLKVLSFVGWYLMPHKLWGRMWNILSVSDGFFCVNNNCYYGADGYSGKAPDQDWAAKISVLPSTSCKNQAPELSILRLNIS